MKLTILGSGTSGGVPRVGGPDNAGDWGSCDPRDPRNRRSRASAVLETGSTTILIDTSPDCHGQLLANRVGRIDAVVWTHVHADHCHGIDDLRTLRIRLGKPIPAYASPPVMSELRRRFTYIFDGTGPYPAICDPRAVPKVAMIGDVTLSMVDQPHGELISSGLRFEHGGKSCVYAIDFSAVTDAMLSLYRGADLAVVDCLRESPHPTHAHLAMSLDLVRKAGIGRAALSHMDATLDYSRLSAKLPGNVVPGHDGLVMEA